MCFVLTPPTMSQRACLFVFGLACNDMKSKSGKYISRQQPMGWKCWVVTSQQSRPGIPVTKLLLLARTRRGHLQQQPLGNWQTDTFECIVVPPVAFQCNSSRQGVPRRSLGHASPPRPRPLHCGHVQRLIVSYVSTPVKSSKRYQVLSTSTAVLPAAAAAAAAAAAFTNALHYFCYCCRCRC